MSRNKTIEDNMLLNLIQQFYNEECKGNSKELKLPKIAEYIAQNGYPSYNVTTLRRNQVARKYIDSLKEISTENNHLVIAYKTIDVEEFIRTNRTPSALKRELINLDAYYKSIVDSSLAISEKNKLLASKLQKKESSLASAQDEIKSLKNALATLKEENNTLKTKNKKLVDIVQEYVYEDIANELLSQDGELINANTHIDLRNLEKNLITSSTTISIPQEKHNDIKSKSNVIKGLFDNLED